MAKKQAELIDAEEERYAFQPAGPCPKDCDDCRSLGATTRQNKPLMTYDWLADAPETGEGCPYVEVQFKNTRKGFYLNHLGLDLHKGDWVAVEGTPGHDIGEVTLTGHLVHRQMVATGFHFDDPAAVRRVFRIARDGDMERYREAKAREHETMLRSRRIAEELGLAMKIGDVEFQGDGQKAIFYYIADGRVDFRQLIKDLAAAFKVRIEMRQIGARQEAGRIGGIGPCGRELCCAKWQTHFQSVGTAAARFQDLSLNPQKLAGQCAKLKCCLNFEVDCYMEAARELPGRDIVLYTQSGEYHLFKTDILRRRCTYSTSKDGPFNAVTITAARAFEVYHANQRGEKPESLLPEGSDTRRTPEFTDGVGDEEINRFDRARKGRKGRKGRMAGEHKAAPGGQHPVPGGHPASGGHPAPAGHSASGGHPASGGHSAPAGHSASGGHPASGGHSAPGDHSASGGHPTSGDHRDAVPAQAYRERGQASHRDGGPTLRGDGGPATSPPGKGHPKG